MRTIDDRYRNDPKFAHLVQVLQGFMQSGEYTPTEIREAAMLAQMHIESVRPRMTVFSPELQREIEFRSNLSAKE